MVDYDVVHRYVSEMLNIKHKQTSNVSNSVSLCRDVLPFAGLLE